MQLYQIVLLVLVAAIVGLYLYKRFTGIDVLKMLIMSKPVVTALTAVVEALCKLVPSKELQIIKTVLDAATDATEIAEKAWLMGQLSREERNPYAKGQARYVLEKAGIEIDDRINAIVDGVIEMTCMVLPHGVEPHVEQHDDIEA